MVDSFPLQGRYAEANRLENLAGPGDGRVAGRQIVKDEGLEGKWREKVILISGVSSGMGVETVKALAPTGATIYGCARNLDKAKAALGEELIGSGQVKLLYVDMSDLESVRQCATEFRKSSKVLNVMINNAAVMNTPYERTKDGFELQFGTNYLAHFLLFYLLQDLLVSSSTMTFNSRVVNVASAGHKYGQVNFDDINFEKTEYNGWVAYGASKTATIYLANEIDRLFHDRGVHGYSVHPGAFTSPNLQKHSGDEMKAFETDPKLKRYLSSLEQACATSVYAAVSKELDGRGGLYLEGASVSPAVAPSLEDPTQYGHAKWAFDEDAEKRLWNLSKQMCKLE